MLELVMTRLQQPACAAGEMISASWMLWAPCRTSDQRFISLLSLDLSSSFGIDLTVRIPVGCSPRARSVVANSTSPALKARKLHERVLYLCPCNVTYSRRGLDKLDYCSESQIRRRRARACMAGCGERGPPAGLELCPDLHRLYRIN